jgi:hypothetical protein
MSSRLSPASHGRVVGTRLVIPVRGIRSWSDRWNPHGCWLGQGGQGGQTFLESREEELVYPLGSAASRSPWTTRAGEFERADRCDQCDHPANPIENATTHAEPGESAGQTSGQTSGWPTPRVTTSALKFPHPAPAGCPTWQTP